MDPPVSSVAVVLYGASFRLGEQSSRVIGCEGSFDVQKAASQTHVELLDYLSSAYDACDVYISSVSTRYDADLIAFYGPRVKGSVFVKQEASYDGYHFLSGNELIIRSGRLTEYDRIVYVRVDLHLKPYIVECFRGRSSPIDKVSFVSICFLPHHKVCCRSPRVNPVITVIPRKYYHLIAGGKMHLNHDTWHTLVVSGLSQNEDFDVLLDTYHDSDSFKDWNPVYYMCGRAQNPTWHSKGLAFNRVTREPDASTIAYSSS
jgi:hypothetical protein